MSDRTQVTASDDTVGAAPTLDDVNESTRVAYDLAAARYHELFHDEMESKAYDRELLNRFAERLGAGPLVCDAGCGPSGHVGRILTEKGVAVIGVDISDRCVELARAHNPDMRFERCDIGEMVFPDATFDGVIAYYSIIHTPKTRVGRLFREFHRVLKPGGRLLLAVKVGTAEGYLTELLGIPTRIYFSLFTKCEIRRHFEAAGFDIELLEQRDPYQSEIKSERIFAVGRRPTLAG